MSERLPREPQPALTPEVARNVLATAMAQGPVDPDVEVFLRGITEGTPKRQLESTLGHDKYQEVRARVVAYAQRIEGGRS